MFSKQDQDGFEFKKQNHLFFYESCSISQQNDNQDSMDYLNQLQPWHSPPGNNNNKQICEEEEELEGTKKIEDIKNQKKENFESTAHSIGKIKEIKKKVKKQKEQKVQKKGVYMLPGQSKNIPKNFTRALKHFITTNFDIKVQLQPEIKKFLNTKPEQACKQTLENSLKNSQLLQQISQMFFGNIQWGNIFLNENKVELEPYFRFNKVWFNPKK